MTPVILHGVAFPETLTLALILHQVVLPPTSSRHMPLLHYSPLPFNTRPREIEGYILSAQPSTSTTTTWLDLSLQPGSGGAAADDQPLGREAGPGRRLPGAPIPLYIFI